LPFEEVRKRWKDGSSKSTDTLLKSNFRSLPAAASTHLSRSGVNMLTPSPSPTPNLLEMSKMDSTHFAIARKSAPPDISGIFSVLKNSN